MKTIITIILLLSISLCAISQTQTNTAYVENQINQVNNRLSAQDSVIKLLHEQNNTIIKENEILNTALNTNTNIFNGLSTYFTVISILLTLIVIAIPVINYFLVLKPNKEATTKLKQLERELPKKIEDEFGEYLAGFEKRTAKKLIQSLGNSANLPGVINFFILNKFSDFDDEDQSKVAVFLEGNAEIEETDRFVLNSILSSRLSLISESYYKRVLENSDKRDYKYAIEYLTENDPEKHIKFWELIITASPKGHIILLDIFQHLVSRYLGSPFDRKSPDKMQLGEQRIKLFLNNEGICNAVRDKEAQSGMYDKMNINVINWNQFIKETHYFKLYFDEKGNRKKLPI